jgi:hypothetical protein
MPDEGKEPCIPLDRYPSEAGAFWSKSEPVRAAPR